MIEVIGTEAIQAKLKELVQLGQNSEPLMHEIGNKVENRIDQNFEEQAYYGEKWAPLKDPSSGFSGKRKGKRGKPLKRFMDHIASRKILINTGLLSKFSVQASADQVIVGTNAWYGKFPQDGTKKKDGTEKMVARRFMPIDKDGNIDPRMSGEIEEYLAGKIKKIVD